MRTITSAEKCKKALPELMALLIYAILNIVMTIYHEPWFDEAESWLIARDASFFDIIFVRPHYEGHPPLWHLILSIPAKLGLPYELSLKSIQFVFAIIMISLIIFRSPFPKYIRLFLPFSFFYFYQYGIIARPYAMFCIAMFLIAANWKTRDTKPWSIVLSMLWLCLSSAYGIIIAGGMTAVWLIESFLEEKKSFWDNRRRIAAWVFLLLMALFIIGLIAPVEDTFALINKHYIRKHGFFWLLLFFWFVIPSDLILTSTSEYNFIFSQEINLPLFISTGVISFIILIMICHILLKRKHLCLFLIPFSILSIVASGGYMHAHHYGLILTFILSVIWIALDSEMIKEQVLSPFPSVTNNKYVKKYSKKLLSLIIILITSVNLFWSIGSLYKEIKYEYYFSRSLSNYIKENNLEKYRWLGCWWIVRDEEENEIVFEDTDGANVSAVPSNPYFKSNLIYNSPAGVSYVPHKVAGEEQNQRYFDEIRNQPDPDFMLVSTTEMPHVKETLNIQSDYSQIVVTHTGMIWKAEPDPNYPFYIYVRSDIYPLVAKSDFKSQKKTVNSN